MRLQGCRGRVWGGTHGIVTCIGSCQRDRPDRDRLAVANILIVKRARRGTCYDIATKNATESYRYVGVRVVDFVVGYAGCQRAGVIFAVVFVVGSCQRDRDRDCLAVATFLLSNVQNLDIATKNATESYRYRRRGSVRFDIRGRRRQRYSYQR